MIYAMVVLGGVTRLTRSGLSMVTWEPIMGVIPPLTKHQWDETFDRYKKFPEYEDINRGMTLREFKSIFYFEYAHRLLGRSIGLVFLLPFLYFLVRRRIRRSLVPKLITMFILGGLQGLLGWYMVRSGLVNQPHVSQYRLTAHLITAFLIYAYILWTALSLLTPEPVNAQRPQVHTLGRLARILAAGVVLVAISGGFVAGTKAGFAFNTFPLMNGHFVPAGYLAMEPRWSNFFDNIATVQFDHRWLAITLATSIVLFWIYARRADLAGRSRVVLHLMLVMVLTQVTLGITTLLFVVPVPLAAAHQAGALMLFTIMLLLSHELRSGPRPVPAGTDPRAVVA